MSKRRVSEHRDGEGPFDSAAVAFGGVFIVAEVKSVGNIVEPNTYRIWDVVLNSIVGEIKSHFHLSDVELIPKHGLLVTSHYHEKRVQLTLWNICSGHGERINFDWNKKTYTKVAVDNSSSVFIWGPHVFDIASRRKIGSLSSWSEYIAETLIGQAFTFNDKFYVMFAFHVLFTWETENFTMVGSLVSNVDAEICRDLKIGWYSHLCMHETDDVLYVWDVAEQKLKCSVRMNESECPFFGPGDAVVLLKKEKDGNAKTICVWDASTLSFQARFSFSGLERMWTCHQDPRLNLMNGKVIVGFNREEDGTLTMVEVDWDTEEVVHTKSNICGDIKEVFVVPSLSILM